MPSDETHRSICVRMSSEVHVVAVPHAMPCEVQLCGVLMNDAGP